MLYCLSFGSLNFREAEELLLGVMACNTNVTFWTYKRQPMTTERKQIRTRCIEICKENNFV